MIDNIAQAELLKKAAVKLRDLENQVSSFNYILSEIELGKIANVEDVKYLYDELVVSDNSELYKKARNYNFGKRTSNLNDEYESSQVQNNDNISPRITRDLVIKNIKEIK